MPTLDDIKKGGHDSESFADFEDRFFAHIKAEGVSHKKGISRTDAKNAADMTATTVPPVTTRKNASFELSKNQL